MKRLHPDAHRRATHLPRTPLSATVLTALRAFEAAARLRSFKAAADELSVTATAISHRIRALERHLDKRLFVRQVRAVSLSPDGERLYAATREGLDIIASAIDTLRTPTDPVVTLSVTPAFASQWLLPRLQHFQAAHPDIDLHIHASNLPADLDAGMADLAVRYGTGPYPGHEHHCLLADRFAPVASPALLERLFRTEAEAPCLSAASLGSERDDSSMPTFTSGPTGADTSAAQDGSSHLSPTPYAASPARDAPAFPAMPAHLIRTWPLIHFDWQQPQPLALNWTSWAEAAGQDPADFAGGVRYSEESHAIQACVAGQGVAFISLLLVERELQQGLLAIVCGPVLDGMHYHLLQPRHGKASEAVARVAAWLKEKAALPGISVSDR